MNLPEFFQAAADTAQHATCQRDKCGSVVVSAIGKIIGRGYNSPPHDLESQRRCTVDKATYHPKVKDTTCCIHAEQRAILDALHHYPSQVVGSTVYFMRLDTNGQPTYAGQPYCTLCSKIALDTGVAFFGLWHSSGAKLYPTPEYNTLSYQYNEYN